MVCDKIILLVKLFIYYIKIKYNKINKNLQFTIYEQ